MRANETAVFPRAEKTGDITADKIRLQVFLAHAGAASRRGAEALIASGRVAVNGVTVTEMGFKVGGGDAVSLDGRPLSPEKKFHYLALNKPEGYICSSSDPQGRPLAKSLLPPSGERLYNAGRLDFRSSGLIFFTNDGDFAAKITHPSSEIEKEYVVESTVPIPDRMVEEFGRGLIIEGVLYKALRIEKTGTRSIRVVLIEGKNREIRRVFSHFHLHTEKLTRVRIGPVSIGDLKEGATRPLTPKEINILMSGEKKWS